jgi:hypothetical protein
LFVLKMCLRRGAGGAIKVSSGGVLMTVGVDTVFEMNGGVIDAGRGTTSTGVLVKGPTTLAGQVNWAQYGTFTMSKGIIKGCDTAGVKIEINGKFSKSGNSTVNGKNSSGTTNVNDVSIWDCVNFALGAFSTGALSGANPPTEPNTTAELAGLAMPTFTITAPAANATDGAQWATEFGWANTFTRATLGTGNFYDVAVKVAAPTTTSTTSAALTIVGGKFALADTDATTTTANLRFVAPSITGTATGSATTNVWTVSGGQLIITATGGFAWNVVGVDAYAIVPGGRMSLQASSVGWTP